MNLTFSGEHGDHIVVPEAVREVFLPSMRNDQRRLAAALELQRLDLMRQLLHRMRGALVIASATHLAFAASLIEDAIAKGAEPEECAEFVLRFLQALDSALSRLELTQWRRSDAPLPPPPA